MDLKKTRLTASTSSFQVKIDSLPTKSSLEYFREFKRLSKVASTLRKGPKRTTTTKV